MKKKVLSAVLALTLVFGSAASLPSGVLTDSTSITASAVGESGVSQSFEYLVLDDGTVQITGYNGSSTTVSIPSTLDGKTDTSIGSSAFTLNNTITKVSIPDTVTTISEYAFLGCSNLTSVQIGKNVTKIVVGAFGGCEGLTTALLPGVEVIGNKAFAYCSKLADVGLGENLRAVGEGAFLNCPEYKHAYIPGSVEQIGTYAFGYGFNGTSYGKLKNFTIHGEKNSQAYKYAGTKTTFVEVGAHTHSGSSIVVPPTCLNEGCTVQICKVCGHLSHSNTVKAKESHRRKLENHCI